MRAIVVDPQAAGRLGIADVHAPHPGTGEALVQVEASSLNRGDILAAQQADAGWRPGHDVAGTVITAAADGTGPKEGSRVVGLLDAGVQITPPDLHGNITKIFIPRAALAEMTVLGVVGIARRKAAAAPLPAQPELFND